MSETPVTGRHRTPGRHNPLSEVAGMVGRVGEHGVKAASVVAASGGLVAAFALPAQAATSTSTKATPQAAAFLAAKTASPSVTVKAAPAAAPAAPAVVAPSTIAPVAAETVGITGVSAVEKPAPPPPPAPVVVAAASVTRASAAPAAEAAPAPAPAVNVPASVGGGVLGIAAAYSGIYYVYGGSTPAGFDCSGFVQYVFGQAGVSLPRTATAQMYATTRVSDPQPGDLVFFGDGGSAYHVGIYAGNGMMYDSPRTGATSGLHSIWSSQVVYGRV